MEFSVEYGVFLFTVRYFYECIPMIKELVQKYLPDCVAFAQELVRLPSVNRVQNEGAVMRYVLQKSFELDIYAQKLEYMSDRPNIVLGKDRKKPRGIWFVAHADTVDVVQTTKRTQDPFGGNIVDGKLYGRGTMDCKSGIALAIYALKILQDLGYPEAAKWIIAVDEENGANSPFGVRKVLEEWFQAEGVLYLFGGNNTGTYLNVGHRGLIRIVVSCVGEEVHPGGVDREQKRKWANAIEAIVQFVTNLQQSRPFYDAPHPYFPGYTTLFTPIHIKWGQKSSVVPAVAEVTLDIRVVPSVAHQQVIDFLESLITQSSTEKIKFNRKYISNIQATVTDVNSAFVQEVVGYLQTKNGGVAVQFKWVWPANETYLFHEKWIPMLTGIWPQGKNAHGNDEYVMVESFLPALTDMVEIALRMRHKST
jgi:succinyl-diaminopimelate desuccinylase